MKKTSILLFLIFAFIMCKAQDTVSVFFETGSAKINDVMAQKLNAIASSFDLQALDSVAFIGLADTTGTTELNMKLSEKRARAVARYCSNLIPESVPSICVASGESNTKLLDYNRRVDVILFFPAEIDSIVVSAADSVVSKCYMVDYFLLHRCGASDISKGKKSYTLVQTLVNVKDTIDYYSGTINQNGEFVAKKIKWTMTKTGFYSAKIPTSDFNRFRIFQLGMPPCNTCSEDFSETRQIQNETSCFQVDRFLMQNIQVRTTPFTFGSVKVRVARELVNLNEKYYVDCSTDSLIKWQSKKGRRKARYLYTTLPEYDYRIANITRFMPCCAYYSEPSQCDSSIGVIFEESFCDDLMFDFEAGCNLMADSSRYYMGLGLNKYFNRSQFFLMAGFDDQYDFFGTFRFRQHILLMPLSGLNPLCVWQSPGGARFPLDYSVYAGAELNLFEKAGYKFEQNLHAGVSICSIEDSILQSIYCQGGIACDYSKVFPFLQCGIQIKIVSSRSKVI